MWYDEFALVEEETKAKGRAIDYLRRLWPFFAPYRGKVAAAGFLLLVASGLSLSGPVLLKRAIDINIARGDMRGLALTSLLYLGVQVAIFFATYFQLIWLAQVGEKGTADIKHRLFAHILRLPMAFFDRQQSGKLVSRVESDTEALKMLFTRTSVVLIQSGLLIFGMSVVMVFTNWRLYLLVLLLLPPFAFAFYLFQKKVRPVYLSVRKTVGEINNLVVETLKGLGVIQAFGQQQIFARKMNDFNRKKYQGEIRSSILWYTVWFLVDFGEVVGIGLVLGLGGLWALQGNLTIGTLVLFVSYISRLFSPLRAISDQINTMQQAFAAAERALTVLYEPMEPAGEDKRELVFQNGIYFERVSFAYDGEDFVLNDIDLQIKKGERIALVGETGGGKSSIVNLLIRFYLPQRGRIRFDQTDLKEIDYHRLRRLIGFVPQEVILFPGTVLDNLRMFDEEISLEQVVAAAKRLNIDERIRGFDKGYNTVISEEGANFSLGERQLLAFARALVRDPEILILDEATSAVDPQTESLIQDGLKELLRGRTAIIIAHRLATIQMVDRVVVIHRGRVAEAGKHEELLKNDYIYARLFRLQFVTDVVV